MKLNPLLLIACCAGLASSSWAQGQAPLPHVLGFSHIAVKARDVEASVAFYRDFLGFAEQGRLMNLPPKNDTLQLAFMKICEDQWLEIFDASHLKPEADRLYQIALHVEDAEVMRARLEAENVGANGRPVPKTVPRYQMKNANFSVFDPHRCHIETVQYLPEGRTIQDRGKFLPPSRISERIISVRAAADDGVASLHFYRDILGFRESGRTPAAARQPERIRLRLQDSTDTVELVFAAKVEPHFTFAVPDVAKARETLEHSAYFPTYGKPIEIRFGEDYQRYILLLDPMGVEVELREAPAARPLISLDASSRLVCRPFNDVGDRIPDFSYCGYRGGGVALPAVPEAKVLKPSGGDDAAAIQSAIDEIARLPKTAGGPRGSLLLKKGRYAVGAPITIKESGIVIRGEGSGEDGTVLVATLRKQHSLISIGSTSESRKDDAGPASDSTAQFRILDDYVPVGAQSVHLDTKDRRPGDVIELVRPGTAEWIHEIGMDQIPIGNNPKEKTRQWTPKEYTFVFERTVLRVEPGTVFFDAPLPQSFDRKYGGGFVRRSQAPRRVSECAIENLRLVSEYDQTVTTSVYHTIATLDNPPAAYVSDEQHGWNGISFGAARDCWVKNVTAVHFGYSHTSIGRSARNITVLDSTCLDPVSTIAGSRRYSFNIAGSLNLVMRCQARNGRHDFVMHNQAAGPNAFVDCEAAEAWATSEVHHRWAMGTLFDNIKVSGRGAGMFAVNRGNMGTGHGWAGNITVFYNCEAPVIMVSQPPTGQNFIIGVRGFQPVDAKSQSARIKPQSKEILPAREGIAQGGGFIESPDAVAKPRSLYLAQLRDRLGQPAIEAVTEAWQQ